MNERLLGLKPYPMETLARRKAELRAAGKPVYDFGTGDPIEPTPGFIRDAFMRGMPEISQYPAVAGLPEMRRAAADYLDRRFGVTIDADREVLPTQGSKEAIFHLPMTFVDPSAARNRIVYGVPAYPVFEIGSYFAEAPVTEVELGPQNGYLLTPDLVGDDVLEQTAMVFLNYPHNPSGALLPPAQFEAWVAAQKAHGFVLVSDECYVDLWYEGEPPHSLLEFGKKGCLVAHSLSKRSGMTGYRSGFVAGDEALIAQYRRFRAGMGVAPTDPVQRAAQVAWADEGHVAERRALFGQKRRVFLDLFAELGLEAFPGPSTLFVWARVPEGSCDVDYASTLLDHGIVASPGSFFGPGQEAFFRLALVPSLDDCRTVAELWPR